MKRILFGLVAALGLCLGGIVYAATGATPSVAPTGLQLTSPVAVCGSFGYNGGTQTSAVPACGGTFTCTSSGTITIVNSNVDANSVFLFGLKTAGSPAAFTVATVTAATGFTVTCGSGDTSVYNYIILG